MVWLYWDCGCCNNCDGLYWYLVRFLCNVVDDFGDVGYVMSCRREKIFKDDCFFLVDGNVGVGCDYDYGCLFFWW